MGLEPICAAAAVASCKSNAAAATQYEHFHFIAAKKSLPLPHRVNGPLGTRILTAPAVYSLPHSATSAVSYNYDDTAVRNKKTKGFRFSETTTNKNAFQ